MKHGFLIEAPDFDLAKTLDSGQVFHWEAHGDGFVGIIGERALSLSNAAINYSLGAKRC